MSNPLAAARKDSAAVAFLVAGLRELERRVAALTAPVDPESERVRAVLEGSTVIRALARAVALLDIAFGESATVGAAALRIERWQSAWPARAVGTALVTAAGVHVVATVLAGRPSGWLWLILPALAAVAGLVLVIAGAAGGAPRIR